MSPVGSRYQAWARANITSAEPHHGRWCSCPDCLDPDDAADIARELREGTEADRFIDERDEMED